MSLPRLPYVVLDTNRLRIDAVVRDHLRRFDEFGERIMLPWTAAYELSKGGGNTFASSMRVLCERPEAVSVAKPSMRLYQEHERRFCVPVRDVTWIESTQNLHFVLFEMREGRLSGEELRAGTNEASQDTRRLMRGRDYEGLFKSGVEGVLRSLPAAERNQIRSALQRGERLPLQDVLVETFTAETLPGFLEAVGVPPTKARRLVRFPSFVALDFVAHVATSLRWAVMGGIETTKKPLENDGVDVENVLIAVYGRGFVTVDRNAMGLYEDICAVVPRIWAN